MAHSNVLIAGAAPTGVALGSLNSASRSASSIKWRHPKENAVFCHNLDIVLPHSPRTGRRGPSSGLALFELQFRAVRRKR